MRTMSMCYVYVEDTLRSYKSVLLLKLKNSDNESRLIHFIVSKEPRHKLWPPLFSFTLATATVCDRVTYCATEYVFQQQSRSASPQTGAQVRGVYEEKKYLTL